LKEKSYAAFGISIETEGIYAIKILPDIAGENEKKEDGGGNSNFFPFFPES
jgi:hypothetical protein